MGPCNSKTGKRQELSHASPIFFPDFYYLRRYKKSLLTVKNKSVHKEHLKGKVKVRIDAGIGITSLQQIVLVGGTDRSGCLTSTTVFIDPNTAVHYHLPDLPMPVKKGFIQEFEGWLYYLGGIVEAPEEESSLHFRPAPLMRFNMQSHHWEILETEPEMHKKKSQREAGGVVYYNDIYQPGTFVHWRKIYLVGGQIVDHKTGEMKPNNRIYSLDLDASHWALHDEDLEVNIATNHPICVINNNNNTLQIFGGKGHDMKIFRTNIEINLETRVIAGTHPFPFFVKEHYPPIYSAECTIIVSFPKIAVHRPGIHNWKAYDFKREDQLEKDEENLIEIPYTPEKPENPKKQKKQKKKTSEEDEKPSSNYEIKSQSQSELNSHSVDKEEDIKKELEPISEEPKKKHHKRHKKTKDNTSGDSQQTPIED